MYMVIKFQKINVSFKVPEEVEAEVMEGHPGVTKVFHVPDDVHPALL